MLRDLLVTTALLVLAAPAVADPAKSRQQEILHTVRHDCGSCHGLTLKGGLGPPLVPATLAAKPNDVLIEIILDGVPGTPMPPWKFLLTEGEATWLVQRLKQGL